MGILQPDGRFTKIDAVKMVPTLRDFDFTDKKVLIRVDFNVPLDENGRVLDETRIKMTLPTLRYILDHGCSKLIIMTHVGRPKNNEQHLRTNKIAERLSTLLKFDVAKLGDYGENGLSNYKVIMLENLRFNPAEKSKDASERDKFGKHLAGLADLYVNDAFANCHRDHASMTSVPKYIPGCIGLLVENEIATISKAINNPERPFTSIIGGLKADKLDAIRNLLPKADHILIGGALGFLILNATGLETGNTKIDVEGLKASEQEFKELANNPKIILPIDAVVADEFSNNSNFKTVDSSSIKPSWMALDIGPKTIELFKKKIEESKTIVWNGPIGVFEFSNFASGTRAVVQSMADSSGTTIVGGGDSAAATEKYGLKHKMTHVSSGGGASLKLIEGSDLVAVKSLESKQL